MWCKNDDKWINSLIRQNWMCHCGTLPPMPSRTTNIWFVSFFSGNFLTRQLPRLRVHEPFCILEHLQDNRWNMFWTLGTCVPISCVTSTHLSGNCWLTCSALSPAFYAQQWQTPTPVFKKIRIVNFFFTKYMKTKYENNIWKQLTCICRY